MADRRRQARPQPRGPLGDPPDQGQEGPQRPEGARGSTVRVLAWLVHFYTALGLVAASGMAWLLIEGGPWAFRGSFALMIVATVIDATDGTLARRVRIKEVLPGFDGRRLDDLVDWLTYTCLPLLLIWKAAILPAGQEAWLIVPLMASAYGFCQTSIKTDDGYFLGFPSLWNIVAFYLYVLDLPPWASLAVVLVLSVLTFVPSRYLYPSSRPGLLNKVSNVGGAAWAALLVAVLALLPSDGSPGHRVPEGLARNLVLVSTIYPAFYMAASWAISARLWLGKATRPGRSGEPSGLTARPGA